MPSSAVGWFPLSQSWHGNGDVDDGDLGAFSSNYVKKYNKIASLSIWIFSWSGKRGGAWLLIGRLAWRRKVKDDVKMANKWRDAPIYGLATQFVRHFHVVLDVPILKLNLPNIYYAPRN